MILVGFTTGASAIAETITIKQIQGNAHYRADENQNWQKLNLNTRLVLPVELKTEAGAHLEIQQGETDIELRENTHLKLADSAHRGEGIVSKVFQWIGRAIYTVEKENSQFEVETPFIVSVVKGTQFIITSTKSDSLITVTEGVVEARNIKTNETRALKVGDMMSTSVEFKKYQSKVMDSQTQSANNATETVSAAKSTTAETTQTITTVNSNASATGISNSSFGQSTAAQAKSKTKGNGNGLGATVSANAKLKVKSNNGNAFGLVNGNNGNGNGNGNGNNGNGNAIGIGNGNGNANRD